jgi:membrane protein required for colicin V production
MNGFDIALCAAVVLSTLFAFVRGVIREMIAILTWVAGFVVAIEYAASVAGWFARLDVAPAVKHVLAFVLILLAVLVVGALAARLLSRAVRAIGLGFVDRVLGAVFGLARGLLAVLAFALVAGVTTLPRHDWWQNSLLGQPLGAAALSLRPYLPRAWAGRLDFSAAGALSARLRGAAAGDRQPCAES